MKKFTTLQEDLRNWFDPKHPEGGWKRVNSKGEAIGPCAREPGEAKPKCMSNEKRAALSKKERAAAVRSKRKHDPNPERKGKPINVSNFGKGKLSESMEQLDEKNVPTNPELWSKAKSLAKSKFDVYPSAYANGWAAKWYKSKGGGWKSVNEEVEQVQEAEKIQKHRPGWMARMIKRDNPEMAAKMNQGKEMNKLMHKYGGKTSDEIAKMKKEEIDQVSEQHREKGRFKPTIPQNVPQTPGAMLRKEQNDTQEKVEMTQSQLHFIGYACDEILDYIKMGGEVEEWYQVKVAKAFSEFESLHAFIEGEKRRTGMVKEETQLDEISHETKASYTLKAKQQVTELEPHAKKGEYKDLAKNLIAKRQKGIAMAKEPVDVPFEGGKKVKGTVTDKSGAKHTPMSRAKDLARKALERQKQALRPVKESESESRKKQIVKNAAKNASNKTKDNFDPNPELSSEIIKQ